MKTYAQFRPTGFDSRGLGLPDRQDWLVCDIAHNRDSELLTESNWDAFLTGLGGESETIEVHRFGHWGPGWFEIIIIDPTDTKAIETAEAMSASLADYPVLDEEDWSRREYEATINAWETMSMRDRIYECSRARVSIFAARRDDMEDDRLYQSVQDHWAQ